MRKGHRRTQSAYIAASTQQSHNPAKGPVQANEIFKLLEASQNKIGSKVINYERLQMSSLQENSFLKFGNFTIQKTNVSPVIQNKKQKPAQQPDLICIPENNKSEEISSQKLSKQGGCRQDDIPPIPIRKIKPKRASDFRRLEIDRNQKSISQIQFSGRRHRRGKSLKKR